ncbi:MAG TPA: hypothetical protein PKZ24_03080, partial [Nitrospirales bacterium]|nr:hypothetical protein [Nitrospirales bacterium]
RLEVYLTRISQYAQSLAAKVLNGFQGWTKSAKSGRLSGKLYKECDELGEKRGFGNSTQGLRVFVF